VFFYALIEVVIALIKVGAPTERTSDRLGHRKCKHFLRLSP